ncbi:MAG: hypothetical protein LBQ15_11255 [Clostridium sp.]|jgi:hypothetical protein|nr:hypothetical protein [Clostridium sp.]
MAWTLLPTDYTDASWSGLKRYLEINNEDGSISLQDVTLYTGKEKSFFGAIDANRMNEAMNAIMSMVENGTDLYGAFQIYFAGQKTLFEASADTTQNEFIQYVSNLKDNGDGIILVLKTDYLDDIERFKSTQEQLFATWFQYVKSQLSEDAAGNLQNKIDALEESVDALREAVCFSASRPAGEWKLWLRDGGVTDAPYEAPERLLLETAPYDAPGEFAAASEDGGQETVTNMTDDPEAAGPGDIVPQAQ